MNIRLSHVWLIANYSMRFALRTGSGLMYLLVYLIAGLLIASVFTKPLETVTERYSPETGYDVGQVVKEFSNAEPVRISVNWWTGADDAQVDHLLVDNPALFSLILIVMLATVPYLTCLGAFNQTSGDIASKGLRFLLIRTERVNIFLGRFLGIFLFTVVASSAVITVIALYVYLKFGIYEFGAIFGWSSYGILAVLLLSLPYIALCAWISCLINSPFGSLAVCLLITGFSVLFLFIAKQSFLQKTPESEPDPEKYDWLAKAVPTGWKYDLLSPSFGTVTLSAFAMLAFTAFFLLLGLRSFNKRDL